MDVTELLRKLFHENNLLNEKIKKYEEELEKKKKEVNTLKKIIESDVKKRISIELNNDEKKFINSPKKIMLDEKYGDRCLPCRSGRKKGTLFFTDELFCECGHRFFVSYSFTNSGFINSDIVQDLFSDRKLVTHLLFSLEKNYPMIQEYVVFNMFYVKGNNMFYLKDVPKDVYKCVSIFPLNYIKNELKVVDKYWHYMKVLVENKTTKIFYYDVDERYAKFMYEDCQRYFIKKNKKEFLD